jgi:hypothetical protein
MVFAALVFSSSVIEVTVRLFAPINEQPFSSYDPGVGIKLMPDQEGMMTLGAFGEFPAPYRINNAGWNSIHDYQSDKPDGTLRIAVIGDSFIEALGVELEESLPAIAEQKLNASEVCSPFDKIEVYSFGYSGIPMSQYVSIMRHVKDRYSPDAYIIHVFPVNDFEPSLERDDEKAAHFLTYRPDHQHGFVEVPHVPYSPSPLKRFASNFATVRYVVFNLRPQAQPLVQYLIGSASSNGDDVDENPNLLPDFTEFVFNKYRTIAGRSPLLIFADADRKKIYVDNGSTPNELSDLDGVEARYFRYIEQSAEALDIDYIPLHPILEADYVRHGERFEFVSDGRTLDGHWNSRAHGLIGEELADWIAKHVCARSS